MCVQTLLDKISPRVSRADFKTNFGKDYLVLIWFQTLLRMKSVVESGIGT